MLHPSTKRLIEKLDEMTRKQRVAWEEGENGAVTHDTEGYRVALTAAPHAMLLTDALGREIETCQPEDFAGETDASGRPFAEFVADLYREAHRHARGAEKAISALLSSLDAADRTDAPAPAPDVESFEHAEDEGDDSWPLADGELPEVETETEVHEAVASMADGLKAAEAAAAEPRPAPAPEPAPEAPAPQAAAPGYAPFAGSPSDARDYAAAADFDAAAPSETPAREGEALPSGDDVWNAIQGAGTQAAAPAETGPAGPAPDAPAEPAPAPQTFSLSGITSGFGLGSTAPATRLQPAPPQAPQTPAQPEQPGGKLVIDGTVDLPDVLPEPEDAAGFAAEQAPASDLSEPARMPESEAAPAPEAPAPEQAEPEQAADTAESKGSEPHHPPSRRFNPWN